VSAAQALRSDARVKAEAGRVRMRCGAEAGARQAEQSGPTRDGPREEGGERLARWKRRREGKFGWAGQRPGREEEKSGPGKLGLRAKEREVFILFFQNPFLFLNSISFLNSKQFQM